MLSDMVRESANNMCVFANSKAAKESEGGVVEAEGFRYALIKGQGPGRLRQENRKLGTLCAW